MGGGSLLNIFPGEINGKGVNKWKWEDFVMQCLNWGLSIVGGNINFFKDLLRKCYDMKGYYRGLSIVGGNINLFKDLLRRCCDMKRYYTN